MKTILLDAAFRLDNPNNRWGEPSCQLEPGDPGYVPPGRAHATQQQKEIAHETE